MSMRMLKNTRVTDILDPQTNVEAVCAEMLPECRQGVLEEGNFPFATKRISLLRNLLAQAELPVLQGSIYDLPPDYISLKWIHDPEYALDDVAYDLEDEYLIVSGTKDVASVYIGYTFDQTDFKKWSPLARRLIAADLAYNVGFELTGNPDIVKNVKAMRDDFAIRAQNAILKSRPDKVISKSHLAGARAARAGSGVGITSYSTRVV